MSETRLPELHTPEARKAVAELVLDLFERWGLEDATRSELLGVSDLAPYRAGKPLPDQADVLARAGHLLAVDRLLQERYPDDARTRDHWPAVPSPAFSGLVPLALMLQGLDGIKQVHDVLSAPDAPDLRLPRE